MKPMSARGTTFLETLLDGRLHAGAQAGGRSVISGGAGAASNG